jgi:hypothetical protein
MWNRVLVTPDAVRAFFETAEGAKFKAFEKDFFPSLAAPTFNFA